MAEERKRHPPWDGVGASRHFNNLKSQSGPSSRRNLSLGDLEWLLLPPITLRQFKLYRDKLSRPVAFAAWAFLSAEVEARLRQPFGRLLPAEWKSGERACVLILAGPNEKTGEIIEDLGRTVLADRSVSYLRPAAEGWNAIQVGVPVVAATTASSSGKGG